MRGRSSTRRGCCSATSRTPGSTKSASAALTHALAERRASGAALLLVTHNLSEGLALATHAAIMRRGKLACDTNRASDVDARRTQREYRELVTLDA